MEDILRNLSDLQIEALKKGIAFDIALEYNSYKVPEAIVKMSYSVTGSISKGYAFNTTFSGKTQPTNANEKLEEIQYFISTVQGPNKD